MRWLVTPLAIMVGCYTTSFTPSTGKDTQLRKGPSSYALRRYLQFTYLLANDERQVGKAAFILWQVIETQAILVSLNGLSPGSQTPRQLRCRRRFTSQMTNLSLIGLCHRLNSTGLTLAQPGGQVHLFVSPSDKATLLQSVNTVRNSH